MSTTVTDDAGTIRITLDGGWGARLFGLPFLLSGLWLGYHLVLNVKTILQQPAALAEFGVGTIVLSIMTAGFLFPGWVLVASRGRVEIDRTAATVFITRDVLIHRWGHARPLSDFSRLDVDLLSTSTRRAVGRPLQRVALAGDRGPETVGLFDDADAALAYARRLSGLLGLPVEDRRYTDAPAEEEA